MRIVRADNPSPMTLDGTRTFVIGRERPVVVDPGPDDPAHVEAVVAALEGRTPVAILLTHAHPDHAAAAAALARRTGAPVRMARGALGWPFPAPRVDSWIADGETVETDDGGLLAVATPGHAPEHLCFLWRGGGAPAGGALLAGDHFMGEGDTTLVAPPEGDLGAYLRSLDRVEALAPGIIHPAHGPAIPDPAAAVERYRAHRMQRIAQAEAALGAARRAGAAAMVDAVYGGGLHPALRPAAEESLRAILAWMVEQGRARAHPDGTYTPDERT